MENNTSESPEVQHIRVNVDLVPGGPIEGLAERILRIVVDELNSFGMDVTRVNVEIEGWLALW
jgi:hypothetical protein